MITSINEVLISLKKVAGNYEIAKKSFVDSLVFLK